MSACVLLLAFIANLLPLSLSLRNASRRIQQPGTHSPGHPDPAATRCASDCTSHWARHIYLSYQPVDRPAIHTRHNEERILYIRCRTVGVVGSCADAGAAPCKLSWLPQERCEASNPPARGGLTRDSPPTPCLDSKLTAAGEPQSRRPRHPAQTCRGPHCARPAAPAGRHRPGDARQPGDAVLRQRHIRDARAVVPPAHRHG